MDFPETGATTPLPTAPSPTVLGLAPTERARVLDAAERYLAEPPRTVTAASSPRSAGGTHDFFSEGDYWWPNPDDPDGPYVQRDGLSNPDNFVEHRRALMRLSVQVPALAAAWLLTGDPRFGDHAARHARAWFLDPSTRMNPHLRFAQAIHGRTTGRGIGVIDTIHLVEVVRALQVLEASGAPGTPTGDGLTADEFDAVRGWFRAYLEWLTTSANGIEEREQENNHGTCWAMQVAAFAAFVGDETTLGALRERFTAVLVPGQIEPDGSMPRELARTKPFGYSLFNLDAFATTARLLSTPEDDLWRFETADGRGLPAATAFLAPFIADRSGWPLPPDVMYDDQWPMRHPSLLFAGLAYDDPDLLALWGRLPADSEVDEVIRNHFVRQPLLWVPH